MVVITHAAATQRGRTASPTHSTHTKVHIKQPHVQSKYAIEPSKFAFLTNTVRRCLHVNLEADSHNAAATNVNGSPFVELPKPPDVSLGRLAPWQVRGVIDFIDDNLSATIRIDELARIARLSPSYFASVFKAAFGATPHQYIIDRRIEKATHLLLHTNLSICDIAIECGFTDQSHLCTLFRKKLGTTPRTLRKRAMQG
jgi:AraC-like DNA-binding protein